LSIPHAFLKRNYPMVGVASARLHALQFRLNQHIVGEFSLCPECHGPGFVPTETGKEILTLINHHFTRMLKDRKPKMSIN
jgi:hypothetical protein